MPGRRRPHLLAIALAVGVVASQLATAPTAGAQPPKQFGVVTDPAHFGAWSTAIGAMPTLDMEFQAWSRQGTLEDHFATARSQGVTAFMVTWEPWDPVPASRGREAQYAVQPAYSNAAIAAGAWDAYIRSFARSVRDSGLTVYVRYAHEMNGNWYPWSHDMSAYRSAWRHVVDLFRAEGATNARFVWSINPNLYQDQATVIGHAWHYWPGSAYVDVIGATMIDFGGVKDYPVARFVDRFRAVHSAFGKRVFITEFQTDYDGRLAWLADLRAWLATGTSWVEGLTLSQAYASRGQTQMGPTVGNLAWSVRTDPEAAAVVRGIVQDVTARAGSV
ncbi:MAG: glycosyl hydrolase [Acidimicrobiia bacterium]